MRIIGGKDKGRRLLFPSGSGERPTSDFLRESLFNLLGSLEEKKFLDLFAGSGSVGLEALSRGVQEVFFVEKDEKLAAVIEKNVSNCGYRERGFTRAADIGHALYDLMKRRYAFDVIFADPPYNRNWVGRTLDLLNQYPVLNEDGIVVIQHSVKENIDEFIAGNIHLRDKRKYGENTLTFLKMERK